MRKSKNICSKSANALNIIKLFIEPLNNKTVWLLETDKINDLQSEKERAKILKKEAGWAAEEIEKIVDFYLGSFLINGLKDVPRFERVKSYFSAAFRDWVENPTKNFTIESVKRIKVVFTDLVIHQNPRYSQYGQIAGMLFSALTLAMLDAYIGP